MEFDFTELKTRACKLLKHKCNTCVKRFQTKDELKEHMKTHAAPFKCKRCNKRFMKKGILERHLRRFHRNRRNMSNLGSESYGKILNNIYSSGTGTSETAEDESFDKEAGHTVSDEEIDDVDSGEDDDDGDDDDDDDDYAALDVDKKDDDYEDEESNSDYEIIAKKRNSNHEDHHYSHGINRYRCKYCKKKFATLNCVKEHSRSHTGERPFKCRYCRNGFSTSGNLLRHERTHTGLKPYVCKVCFKRFTQSTSLVNHTERRGCISRLSCPVCHQKCDSTESLREHLMAHKDGPFTCNKCGNKFQIMATMLAHRTFCRLIVKQENSDGKSESFLKATTKEARRNRAKKRLSRHENRKTNQNQDKKDSAADVDLSKVKEEVLSEDERKNSETESDQTDKDKEVFEYDATDHFLSSLLIDKHVRPTVCARCKNVFMNMETYEKHKKFCSYKVVSEEDFVDTKKQIPGVKKEVLPIKRRRPYVKAKILQEWRRLRAEAVVVQAQVKTEPEPQTEPEMQPELQPEPKMQPHLETQPVPEPEQRTPPVVKRGRGRKARRRRRPTTIKCLIEKNDNEVQTDDAPPVDSVDTGVLTSMRLIGDCNNLTLVLSPDVKFLFDPSGEGNSQNWKIVDALYDFR